YVTGCECFLVCVTAGLPGRTSSPDAQWQS
ncbi:hypothetical protein A2U01_0110224, partial [Trifolium medium]|nr:hypothetical protein [Trifolium medium]